MICFLGCLMRRRAAIGLLAIGCGLESPAMGQEVEIVEDGVPAGPAIQINAAPLQPAVALKQQFVLGMRPLLQAELSFIRKVCPPAADRREKIKVAGEAALEQAAEELAKAQGQMGGFRIFLGVRTAERSKSNPRQTIQEALGKVLQESVPAEDFARYQEENSKRSARQKRAAIMVLVARLDATLFLTSEQREKISESIAAKWQGKWQSWMNFNQMGTGYMPMLPDELIIPHLTKNQKLIWSKQQKIDIDFTDAMGMNDNQDQDDDSWWGDAP